MSPAAAVRRSRRPRSQQLDSARNEAREALWTDAHNRAKTEELIGLYRDHFLDVAACEVGWAWSAIHPIHCRSRGAAGVARDRGSAQTAAIAAVDGFACLGSAS